MPSGDEPAFAFDDSEPSDLVHLSCKQGALRNQYTWDFIFCNASVFLIQQTRVEYLLWARNVLKWFYYTLWVISRYTRHCHCPQELYFLIEEIRCTQMATMCAGGKGMVTVTCHKRGTNFHHIEEGTIASSLKGTKPTVCRKLGQSCPLRMVVSGQVGVSSGLLGRAHGGNWKGRPRNFFIANSTYSVSSICVFVRKIY